LNLSQARADLVEKAEDQRRQRHPVGQSVLSDLAPGRVRQRSPPPARPSLRQRDQRL